MLYNRNSLIRSKMSYVYQAQNKEFLSTCFTIEKDSVNHNTANIEEIIINGDMCNCVDYKSNYFAYLTKEQVNNKSQNFFISGCDKESSLVLYLLYLLRIPVKKYKSRQELINEINKTYANSITEILIKNYFDDSGKLNVTGTTRNGTPINTDAFDIKTYGYRKMIDLLSNNNLYITNNLTGFNNADIRVSRDEENPGNTIDFSNNNIGTNNTVKIDFKNSDVDNFLEISIKDNSSFGIVFASNDLTNSFNYSIEYYINTDYLIEEDEPNNLKMFPNNVYFSFKVNDVLQTADESSPYYRLMKFFVVDEGEDTYYSDISLDTESMRYLNGIIFDCNDDKTEYFIYFFKNGVKTTNQSEEKGGNYRTLEILKLIIYPYQTTNNFSFDLFSIVDYNTDIADAGGTITYRLNNSKYPSGNNIVETYNACVNKIDKLTIRLNSRTTLTNCTIAFVRGNITITSEMITTDQLNEEEKTASNPVITFDTGDAIIYNKDYKTNGEPEYIYCSGLNMTAVMNPNGSLVSLENTIDISNIVSLNIACQAYINSTVPIADPCYMESIVLPRDDDIKVTFDKNTLELYPGQLDILRTDEYRDFSVTNVNLTDFVNGITNNISQDIADKIKAVTTINVYNQNFSILADDDIDSIIVKYKQFFSSNNTTTLMCEDMGNDNLCPYDNTSSVIARIEIPMILTLDTEASNKNPNIDVYFKKINDNDLQIMGTSFSYEGNYTMITPSNMLDKLTSEFGPNGSLMNIKDIILFKHTVTNFTQIDSPLNQLCDNLQLKPIVKVPIVSEEEDAPIETNDVEFNHVKYLENNCDFGLCLRYVRDDNNVTCFYGKPTYNINEFINNSDTQITKKLKDTSTLTIQLNSPLLFDAIQVNNDEIYYGIPTDEGTNYTMSYKLKDNTMTVYNDGGVVSEIKSSINVYETTSEPNSFSISNTLIHVNINDTTGTNYVVNVDPPNDETITLSRYYDDEYISLYNSVIQTRETPSPLPPIDTEVINEAYNNYLCNNISFNNMVINIVNNMLCDITESDQVITFNGGNIEWKVINQTDVTTDIVFGDESEREDVPLETLPDDYVFPEGVTKDNCKAIDEVIQIGTSTVTNESTKYILSNLVLHINNNALYNDNNNVVIGYGTSDDEQAPYNITFTITGDIQTVNTTVVETKTYIKTLRYYIYAIPEEPDTDYGYFNDFALDMFFEPDEIEELIDLLSEYKEVGPIQYGDVEDGESTTQTTTKTSTYAINDNSNNNLVFALSDDNNYINTGLSIASEPQDNKIKINNVDVVLQANVVSLYQQLPYKSFELNNDSTIITNNGTSNNGVPVVLNNGGNSVLIIDNIADINDNLFDTKDVLNQGITGSMKVTNIDFPEDSLTFSRMINGQNLLSNPTSTIEYISTSGSYTWYFDLSNIDDENYFEPIPEPDIQPYKGYFNDNDLYMYFEPEEVEELIRSLGGKISKSELDYLTGVSPLPRTAPRAIYEPEEVSYKIVFTSTPVTGCEISSILNNPTSIRRYRIISRNTDIENLITVGDTTEITGDQTVIEINYDNNLLTTQFDLNHGTVTYVDSNNVNIGSAGAEYVIRFDDNQYDMSGLSNRVVDTGFSSASYISLLSYSSVNLDIDKYMVVHTGNKFDTIYSQKFAKVILINNLKIITNYDEERNLIEYARDIIPVRVNVELISSLNSPLRNSNKSELFTTVITKPCINIKNNKIVSSTNTRIHINNIDNDSYYNSFNCIRSSIMDYISVPQYTITLNTNNIFSIENVFNPVIKGNKMIAFVYTSNEIFSNATNTNVPLNTITFYNNETIYNKLDFYNKMKLNICFTYSRDIDNILNNNNNYSNVVFNVLSEDNDYTADQNQYRITINKNINLSDDGVNIYITSDKFQYPFISNLSMIKYSYLE